MGIISREPRSIRLSDSVIARLCFWVLSTAAATAAAQVAVSPPCGLIVDGRILRGSSDAEFAAYPVREEAAELRRALLSGEKDDLSLVEVLVLNAADGVITELEGKVLLEKDTSEYLAVFNRALAEARGQVAKAPDFSRSSATASAFDAAIGLVCGLPSGLVRFDMDHSFITVHKDRSLEPRAMGAHPLVELPSNVALPTLAVAAARSAYPFNELAFLAKLRDEQAPLRDHQVFSVGRQYMLLQALELRLWLWRDRELQELSARVCAACAAARPSDSQPMTGPTLLAEQLGGQLTVRDMFIYVDERLVRALGGEPRGVFDRPLHPALRLGRPVTEQILRAIGGVTELEESDVARLVLANATQGRLSVIEHKLLVRQCLLEQGWETTPTEVDINESDMANALLALWEDVCGKPTAR